MRKSRVKYDGLTGNQRKLIDYLDEIDWEDHCCAIFEIPSNQGKTTLLPFLPFAMNADKVVIMTPHAHSHNCAVQSVMGSRTDPFEGSLYKYGGHPKYETYIPIRALDFHRTVNKQDLDCPVTLIKAKPYLKTKLEVLATSGIDVVIVDDAEKFSKDDLLLINDAFSIYSSKIIFLVAEKNKSVLNLKEKRNIFF